MTDVLALFIGFGLVGTSIAMFGVVGYMSATNVWGAVGVFLTAAVYYAAWKTLRALHRKFGVVATSLDDPSTRR